MVQIRFVCSILGVDRGISCWQPFKLSMSVSSTGFTDDKVNTLLIGRCTLGSAINQHCLPLCHLDCFLVNSSLVQSADSRLNCQLNMEAVKCSPTLCDPIWVIRILIEFHLTFDSGFCLTLVAWVYRQIHYHHHLALSC